jgi:hypothetical protein
MKFGNTRNLVTGRIKLDYILHHSFQNYEARLLCGHLIGRLHRFFKPALLRSETSTTSKSSIDE